MTASLSLASGHKYTQVEHIMSPRNPAARAGGSCRWFGFAKPVRYTGLAHFKAFILISSKINIAGPRRLRQSFPRSIRRGRHQRFAGLLCETKFPSYDAWLFMQMH